jgi:hypothetical protein
LFLLLFPSVSHASYRQLPYHLWTGMRELVDLWRDGKLNPLPGR